MSAGPEPPLSCDMRLNHAGDTGALSDLAGRRMRVLLEELPDQDVRLVGGDRLAVLFLSCRGLLGERAELKRMKPVFEAFQQHPQGIRYVRQGRAEAVVGVPSVVGIFEQGRRVKTGRLAPPGKIVRFLDELPQFFCQHDPIRVLGIADRDPGLIPVVDCLEGGCRVVGRRRWPRQQLLPDPLRIILEAPDSSEAFFFPMLSAR